MVDRVKRATIKRELTSDVEDCFAWDLSELVAGSQLVLAGVLRLHVVDEQHDDAVVVADVVSSWRVDLPAGRRPCEPRRWIRFQTRFQSARDIHSFTFISDNTRSSTSRRTRLDTVDRSLLKTIWQNAIVTNVIIMIIIILTFLLLTLGNYTPNGKIIIIIIIVNLHSAFYKKFQTRWVC